MYRFAPMVPNTLSCRDAVVQSTEACSLPSPKFSGRHTGTAALEFQGQAKIPREKWPRHGQAHYSSGCQPLFRLNSEGEIAE